MEIETSRDVGEEIIMKLKELEKKLNKLLKIKNEKKCTNSFVDGD